MALNILPSGSTAVHLTSGNSYYVAQGTLISSSNEPNGTLRALANNNDIRITVDGIVIGEQTGIALTFTSGGVGQNHIVVGETGIVRGLQTAGTGNSIGVWVLGDDSGITNDGQISGYLGATIQQGENTSLDNTGIIRSDGPNTFADAVQLFQAFTSVYNSGEILGNLAANGLHFFESSGIVTNTGTIHGNRALYLSSGGGSNVIIDNSGTLSGANPSTPTIESEGSTLHRLTLNNSGKIFGSPVAIELVSGANTVRNSGHIEGDIFFGNGNDRYNARDGVTEGLVEGQDGHDTLRGSQLADDTLIGGNGDDEIWGRGGDDALAGDGGVDTILGQNGNDLIFGGGKRDFLTGGRGDDTLSGGGGSDIFIFGRQSDDDRITDFQDGSDLIDLTALNIADFATLNSTGAITNLSGGGVAIDLSLVGGDGTLWIDGISAGQLSASDFLF